MIRVVTIAREYGSGGGSIARILAEKLGWKLLDRELISDLARRVHCAPEAVARLDEHPPSFLSRMMRAYWMGSADTWAAPPAPDVLDEDRLAAITRDVILEAARLGNCVIVGRGSQCVLQDRPDVFHVFVYAPREERLRRLLLHRHKKEDEAEMAMLEVDRIRASYVRRYHGHDWTDRHLYNLMMNSEVGDSRVAETIVTAAKLIPGHV
ncbi:MAG TPA: cytidylate kinase-like family protein [Terriglobales bacterium]|nr:cytidylate kinase-like family protein [Terriglobales bacterium]